MDGKLIVTEGNRERIHEILESITVIGRGSAAHLHVRDPEASALHCEIRLTPNGFKVVDLESRTGTRLNGRFVNQEMLRHGDEITIGKTVITFSGESATEPPVPLSGPQVLTTIPKDEHGEPRRFYRHEGGRGGGRHGSPSGIVVISLVLIGAGVFVAWLLSRASKQTENMEHLTHVRELVRTARTDKEFRLAASELEQLDTEIVEAAEVAALRRRIAQGQRALAEENERNQILNSADPKATWDQITRRVAADISSKSFADAYRVMRIADKSDALWKVGGSGITDLRKKLDAAYSDYAKGRLQEAFTRIQKKDSAGALKIYEEIEAVGVAPFSEDASRALERLLK